MYTPVWGRRLLVAAAALSAACIDLTRPPSIATSVDAPPADTGADAGTADTPADALATDTADDTPPADGACLGAAPGTPDIACGGYVCGPTGTACLTSCTGSADCAAPFVCRAGRCQSAKDVGTACASAGECSSGFCEQGICCTSVCTGTCMSCAHASPGQCMPVASGQDPLAHCADEGAPGCGLDGSCDGAGACRKYLAGQSCGGGTCVGSTAAATRVCDGKGTCLPATPGSCAPYVCGDAGKCLASCRDGRDCLAGAACQMGTCVGAARANGQPCTAGNECVSGSCAQGVCCNRACTGSCEHCNLSGAAGTCTLVPSGQDPLGQCPEQPASGCGNDGQCDGAGRCRLYAAGTVCGQATCQAGVFSGAQLCDGAGLCRPTMISSCGKYQCGSGACLATCRTSQDCVNPSVCSAGACGGLRGAYYQGSNFEVLRITRTDPYVDFSWPSGVSPTQAVSSDGFSVRWSGKVTPRRSEVVTFYTVTDDGVRLWVDGRLLIDDWIMHSAAERSATILLQGERAYDIRMDYFESTANASARLLWSSPTQPKEIVPTSRLTP